MIKLLDNILFHGTAKLFDKFDLSFCGKGTNMQLGHLGIYFTPCAELASNFCRHEWSSNDSDFRQGSHVIPVKINATRVLEMDAIEWIQHSNDSVTSIVELRNSYIQQGYDCLIIKTSDYICCDELYVPQVIVLNPAIIEYAI